MYLLFLVALTLAFSAVVIAGDIHERTAQDIDNALVQLNEQFPGMVSNAGGLNSASGAPAGGIVTVEAPAPVVTTQQHLAEANNNIAKFKEGEKDFGTAKDDAARLQNKYEADRNREKLKGDKPVDVRDIEKSTGRLPVKNPVEAHHD